ncbi:hypothetical protein JMJ77_0011020 [Colletotrichum scovillei]|uniref:Uncharacterized protein n=1 Tax=Colletotrichum scovillei TaxID=1209932 RepID=A0A9P7R2Y6_9PEZI|nr:hypothetical protein JMJ77_0011020 [Colletotrichum scovillei]KAG7059989.1 hypothetical protein JMJ78_0015272 [Colletotrichum scovillei]KAG7067441.1 hypothetical protein JMJ76_0008876 [Colletotrichum scovillei]
MLFLFLSLQAWKLARAARQF